MKSVLTRKPLLEGGDVSQDPAVRDQVPPGVSSEDLSGMSAQVLADLAELASFKAKCP